MIVLDTNVISEPLRLRGSPAVTAWLDRQVAETLFVTATSLSEILLGVELLAPGRRKDALASAVSGTIARLFGPRILPFDARAAEIYATLVGRARSVGRVIPMADGQIAAIAAARGFAVATRDAAPFEAAEVPIIDPWHA